MILGIVAPYATLGKRPFRELREIQPWLTTPCCSPAAACMARSGLSDPDRGPRHGNRKEQAVARGFHDPAAMFLDFGIGQLAPQRFQARQGAFLVDTHKQAVTRFVRID
jgi:hypothetical protein